MIQIYIFGASGDLAKRKTFPALFGLYRHGYLHDGSFTIIGYARSELSRADFEERLRPFLKKALGDETIDNWETLINKFLGHCQYLHGGYDSLTDYARVLKPTLVKGSLRLFYMALPPTVFLSVAKMIKEALYDKTTANRLVVEKPFGQDFESSAALQRELQPLYGENELYRIDHYLGKEMVKNLLVLRFANVFFEALWNADCIASVQVVFKETLGVEGRGGYYDEYGVIRDVMQNHMLQMLSLVLMDRPKSLGPEDIRDAKVEALRRVKTLSIEDVTIGQYSRSEDGLIPGYTDDETVSSSSLTATYAMAVCYSDAPRWRSVPLILRTGKALNEAKSEIRIQFRSVPDPPLFTTPEGEQMARNELVLRVQPNEAVYVKLATKKPGLGFEPLLTDLDLSYSSRFGGIKIPDAYEALLLDVLQGGQQQNFVRADELAEAWRIVTPILKAIDEEHIKPILYPAGSRGPKEVDRRLEDLGYIRSKQEYWPWTPGSASPVKPK